jgi:hypothetical protein
MDVSAAPLYSQDEMGLYKTSNGSAKGSQSHAMCSDPTGTGHSLVTIICSPTRSDSIPAEFIQLLRHWEGESRVLGEENPYPLPNSLHLQLKIWGKLELMGKFLPQTMPGINTGLSFN